ncbi:cell envelope integrity protein TolA [Vibrio parahaemolyticus]|uniref:cell envelope integrity protein TolA n=1 Tax=Vibrio parahaemolyticus TaxID=670 RepID=UPI00288CEC60|nr:cell envelope integrity protein TolA [Vibrio parahaemolyticus]EJC7005062.1 cell envelope integrity protein TolA [Vibrio parahaemolyticus]EJC7024278.1 cell envelope integrity protein TolA [Vibrio parahaemolyticus]EJC7173836.1 cell envelope integrity protein TolA [Vibrio parahaemolyticus]EJF4095467.1 cell envelope integrity protein TolA [Vibrio parahaemolyticus]
MRFVNLFVLCGFLNINSATAEVDIVEKEKKEQKAALENIFDQLSNPTPEQSEISKYAGIYTETIQNALPKDESYKGAECRLTIQLSPEGLVKNVHMDIQNRLCRSAFNAIWDIAEFPLPLDKKVASKLTNIRLTLSY